ncbi:hypothetical protein [Caproiciproducens sp. CPB-2]|uniref:hypothetical protein n=1 Tax=Caproiciproducens sp. CPB-2 TaxID=3030017 RepID=UPI0023DC71E6|nr:hypothetical protein [Caproiciproducens sp. CPB-2]MDF1495961.1 hypothetical protein [Caproiciproducens sp. CPB-2]
MRTWKKFLAGFLAAVILAPSLVVPAQAAAPSVTTDESMYVNLDHYGKVEQVNVVKRVDLNGNSQFTDYGSYEKVTNMSNLTEPSVSSQGVTWKLPESSGSFFYECALKPEGATLPWSFDVSYKLNGVPTDAENLAGASGMVEISVKAVPNRNVSDYYKNNMLLQAGTMIDMEDTLSIEAPGAQVQTVGKSKLVMFAALPGEETTFNMRIGTKKFETDGLVLMMVPGSLDQMKDIKDLKEDKDTMEDSVDAIHDSTNVILGTIESMSVGLKRTQSGLSALDRARGTISSEKDGLYDKADLSLADLTAVAQQTALLVPHLQSAQQMVKDVNGDLNALTKTVGEAKPYLASLNSSIGKIQDDVKDLREVLDNIDNTSSDRNEVLGDMRKDIESARAGLTALQPLLTDLSKNLGELSALLEQLQQALGETDPANAALFASLKKVADSTNGLVYAMGLACGQADEYLDTADKTSIWRTIISMHWTTPRTPRIRC